jgi:hypothetical protein
MARALVFVDDAVRGRLPGVCAKTGVTTADHLVQTVPVGGNEGLGIAWLLILAGPIGWFALFVYALARRVETLTVRLPYSDAAYHELAGARRRRRDAAWAGALFLLGALLVFAPALLDARAAAAALAVIGAGLLVVAIAGTWRIRQAGVGVELDGSRRWVTLTRVSDAFAAAATAQLEERERQRA